MSANFEAKPVVLANSQISSVVVLLSHCFWHLKFSSFSFYCMDFYLLDLYINFVASQMSLLKLGNLWDM